MKYKFKGCIIFFINVTKCDVTFDSKEGSYQVIPLATLLHSFALLSKVSCT